MEVICSPLKVFVGGPFTEDKECEFAVDVQPNQQAVISGVVNPTEFHTENMDRHAREMKNSITNERRREKWTSRRPMCEVRGSK